MNSYQALVLRFGAMCPAPLSELGDSRSGVCLTPFTRETAGAIGTLGLWGARTNTQADLFDLVGTHELAQRGRLEAICTVLRGELGKVRAGG